MVSENVESCHFWRWTAQRTTEIELVGANVGLYVAQHGPKRDYFAQFSDVFFPKARVVCGSKRCPIVFKVSTFGTKKLFFS